MDDQESFAVSVRLEPATNPRANFNRRHALRLGSVPEYVDRDRSGLNSLLVPYLTPYQIKAASQRNRGQKRRAAKSDAAVATDIIITFGKGAQAVFNALPVAVQNEAYRAIAERVTQGLGLPVAGLVAHRDETAPHAHAQTLAYLPDGRPVSKAVRAKERAAIQTWAAEAIAPFAPQIVRGKPRAERVKDGEPRHRVQNLRVKELHDLLPAQIEGKRRDLDKLKADEAKLRDRAADLEAKADRTEAEAKRLEVYRGRLEKRARNLAAVTAETLLPTVRADLESRIAPAVLAETQAKAKATLEALRERERVIEQREADLDRRAGLLSRAIAKVAGIIAKVGAVLGVELVGKIGADLERISAVIEAPEPSDDPINAGP